MKKNNIRYRKSKGSQCEMDFQHSLKPLYPDLQRLGGIGQFLEFDLLSELKSTAFEVKRHKAFSWNELVKYYIKLEVRAKEYDHYYLLFKPDRQPALVMYRMVLNGELYVSTFENVFGVPFEKH